MQVMWLAFERKQMGRLVLCKGPPIAIARTVSFKSYKPLSNGIDDSMNLQLRISLYMQMQRSKRFRTTVQNCNAFARPLNLCFRPYTTQSCIMNPHERTNAGIVACLTPSGHQCITLQVELILLAATRVLCYGCPVSAATPTPPQSLGRWSSKKVACTLLLQSSSSYEA